MRSYKNRLNQLDKQIPADEDDTIIVIRLAWDEDERHAPIVYRRSADGTLIKKVGIDTIPSHLAGAAVDVRWADEGLEPNSLI